MRKWIKCPYPGGNAGQGKWFECNTPWLNYMFKWTKLPKCESEDQPKD